MAYGIEVITSTGAKNTYGINTSRVVSVYSATTMSGSTTVSGFDSDKGDYTYVISDWASFAHDITWNNTTKTFTWGKHTGSIPDSAYAGTFDVFFFHYK